MCGCECEYVVFFLLYFATQMAIILPHSCMWENEKYDIMDGHLTMYNIMMQNHTKLQDVYSLEHSLFAIVILVCVGNINTNTFTNLYTYHLKYDR